MSRSSAGECSASRGDANAVDSVVFTNVPAFVQSGARAVHLGSRDLRVDIAFGGVFCAAGASALRRDYRRAAALLGGYLLAFVLFWMAAGQNPNNLVPYFRRSWEM